MGAGWVACGEVWCGVVCRGVQANVKALAKEHSEVEAAAFKRTQALHELKAEEKELTSAIQGGLGVGVGQGRRGS